MSLAASNPSCAHKNPLSFPLRGAGERVPVCTVCQHLRSAPTYISWGKGTSQTPTVTTFFLFPSRGASVLRAELQQCQLQHQQRQLAHPAPSLPALRTPGAAVRLPTAKSGTAQGVLSSLWLLGGVNDTSRPGLFTSLSKKRRGGKTKKGSQGNLCVCRRGLGDRTVSRCCTKNWFCPRDARCSSPCLKYCSQH